MRLGDRDGARRWAEQAHKASSDQPASDDDVGAAGGFVKEGAKLMSHRRPKKVSAGIFSEASDWLLRADLGGSFTVPFLLAPK